MLFIVATPIGNLEDITLRAIRVLKEADAIAAEDTRHARILLKKYDITTPAISFHAHSGDARIRQLVDMMKEGKKVALISDAGTPGISDPGYVLIQAALGENITVTPIPGPSAFLAALSASGLPTHQFLYLGFLPLKRGRQTLLKSLQQEKRTIVFYESPHRLLRTLTGLTEYFEDRPLVIGRELTKLYEEFFRGTTAQALEHFGGNSDTKPSGTGKSTGTAPTKPPAPTKSVRGEFVLMLGAPPTLSHSPRQTAQ